MKDPKAFTNNSTMVVFRIENGMKKALYAYAKKQETSVSNVIRALVQKLLAK